jgi:hypothetical protein
MKEGCDVCISKLKSYLNCNRKISFWVMFAISLLILNLILLDLEFPVSVRVRGSISAVAGVQLDPPGLVQLL